MRMNELKLTFGNPWRVGVLALVGWMAFAAVEKSSELALLALPLLVGLWICVVVVFDRWMRNGENFL